MTRLPKNNHFDVAGEAGNHPEATLAPFRAVELVGRGFIPVRRRRGMNPPATSQTRLKPATSVLLHALAETMINAPDGVKYHLNKLRRLGRIRHVGATKKGRWEVRE